MSNRQEPGLQLRALRQAYGKTQLDIELDAELGIGYLQRLELGKVQRPEHATLLRIVNALEATFAERRTIFEYFGYAVPFSLPNNTETQQAIDTFLLEVAPDTIPAYLLDCSHRLLRWNALVPYMYHAVSAGSEFAIIPRLIFDPAYEIENSILNRDEFFSTQVRIIHYEKHRCSDEQWFASFIAYMREVPNFDKYWVKQISYPITRPIIRPLANLQLSTSHGPLKFRLTAQNFAQDPRFRVIYCIPSDATTINICQKWSLNIRS